MSESDASQTPVPNVRPGAVSGIDHEPLTPRERSTLAGHPAYREQRDGEVEDGYIAPVGADTTTGGPSDQGSHSADGDDGEPLRGQALDDALEDAGLSKSGTADEKRQRLADHEAGQKS